MTGARPGFLSAIVADARRPAPRVSFAGYGALDHPVAPSVPPSRGEAPRPDARAAAQLSAPSADDPGTAEPMTPRPAPEDLPSRPEQESAVPSASIPVPVREDTPAIADSETELVAEVAPPERQATPEKGATADRSVTPPRDRTVARDIRPETLAPARTAFAGDPVADASVPSSRSPTEPRATPRTGAAAVAGPAAGAAPAPASVVRTDGQRPTPAQPPEQASAPAAAKAPPPAPQSLRPSPTVAERAGSARWRPAPKPSAAPAGIRIDRVDVTIVSEAPKPRPAAPEAPPIRPDSLHYVRRF